MSEVEIESTNISEKLDALALRILRVMQSIIAERQYLDNDLKEGYINLAKSRYLMTGQRVDISNVNTNNLRAILKVNAKWEKSDIEEYTSFNLSKTNSFSVDNMNVTELRKRKGADSDGNINNMQNFSILPEDNPLRWFGVLVPESLKVSQSRFNQATLTCLNIATLQNELKALGHSYRKLRKQKNSLIK